LDLPFKVHRALMPLPPKNPSNSPPTSDRVSLANQLIVGFHANRPLLCFLSKCFGHLI
jgi:hypothetical protein